MALTEQESVFERRTLLPRVSSADKNVCLMLAEPLLGTFDGHCGLAPIQPRECKMDIEASEQGNLIGSDKVEGTAVYGADNEKIGSIERVMIDKVSGKVSYAVLSFGGFLGIGDEHYPLPWQSLKYDTSLGGYRTGVTQKQLEGAPKYGNDNSWDWADDARTRSVNNYYGF
jgi:PRC-barrel domain